MDCTHSRDVSSNPYRPTPPDAPPHAWPLDPSMVATTPDLPGHRVLRAFGVVQGVGRHSHEGGLALGVPLEQRLVEGYEEAFAMALHAMMARAVVLGANAVVGVRSEVTAWADGVPAVVAYGTAVRVEVEP